MHDDLVIYREKLLASSCFGIRLAGMGSPQAFLDTASYAGLLRTGNGLVVRANHDITGHLVDFCCHPAKNASAFGRGFGVGVPPMTPKMQVNARMGMNMQRCQPECPAHEQNLMDRLVHGSADRDAADR